jgi:hypothetical protein
MRSRVAAFRSYSMNRRHCNGHEDPQHMFHGFAYGLKSACGDGLLENSLSCINLLSVPRESGWLWWDKNRTKKHGIGDRRSRDWGGLTAGFVGHQGPQLRNRPWCNAVRRCCHCDSFTRRCSGLALEPWRDFSRNMQVLGFMNHPNIRAHHIQIAGMESRHLDHSGIARDLRQWHPVFPSPQVGMCQYGTALLQI